MTIKMDKQIIFENIEQWEEFCDVNSKQKIQQ